MISPVVAAMALQLTQSAGDVWWEGSFDEAIHGTKADRALAFMAGQSGGLEACGFQIPKSNEQTDAPRGVDPRGATSELGECRYGASLDRAQDKEQDDRADDRGDEAADSNRG